MKNIVKRATLLAQSSFITLLELGTELLETPASSNTSIALRNEETEKRAYFGGATPNRKQ